MSGWFDLPQNSICRRTEVRGKRPGRHCRAPTRSAPSSTSGQGTRWACSTGASCVCSRILDMCASNRTAARTAIRRRKVSCKVGSQCVPQPSYGRCTLVRLLHRSAAVRDHACVPTKLSTDMVVEIKSGAVSDRTEKCTLRTRLGRLSRSRARADKASAAFHGSLLQ